MRLIFTKYMIALTRVDRGFIITGTIMVALYCIFWFIDVLFLGGDYDGLGLFFLPLAACLYCAIAFWLIIFPSVHFVVFAVNKIRLDDRLLSGTICSTIFCAVPGILLGLFTEGTTLGALLWSAFGGLSGFLFFRFSATIKESEQIVPANRQSDGTSGMPSVDPAMRAGNTLEAGGDS